MSNDKTIVKKTNKTDAKSLPNNLEAELSVLGCALISDDACVGIMGKIKQADFYSETNQLIFGAMSSLFDRNVAVDYITLTDELEKNNSLEAVGGAQFVMSLTNMVPSAARWSNYVDIVIRCAINRRLILACDKVISKAYNGDEDSLSDAEKAVYELAEKGQEGDLEHIAPYLSSVMAKFEDINKNGVQTRGIPSGFYAIDEITHGFQRSDLILVAARPAVGKSALSLNFMTNAARKGYKCAVFSLEMSKEQLVQRMICSVAGVDMTRALSAKLSSSDWTKLFNAMNELNNIELYIDDSALSNPSQILSKCRKLKREKGLDMVMIDYLQLMYSEKKSDNRQTEVADNSRRMKLLAKELDVPVILLSQLSRAVENRTNKKPILSDLRESGSIEQDADIVMFIHKPEEMKGVEREGEASDYVAEIIFAKHRSGKVGSAFIGWKGSRVSFVNLPRDSDAQSLEESAPPEPVHRSSITKVDDALMKEVFSDDEFGEFVPPEEPSFSAPDFDMPASEFEDPNKDIFED